jgi:gliding motility-associated-like protein
VNPDYNINISESICDGERIVVGGVPYSIEGQYTIVLSSVYGCDSTINLDLTVNSLPQADFSIIGSGILCQGDSITLQLNTEQGNTIEWYLNDTLIVGANGNSIPVIYSGIYGVVVTSPFGCITELDSFIVVNFTPNSNLSSVSDSTLCDGDVILLSADPGFSDYQWYNDGVLIQGANGDTYPVTTTGNYSVLIENQAGCQQITREQNIRFDPIPVAKIVADNDILCDRDDTLLLSSEVTHAVYQWYYNGVLIQDADEQTLAVTQEGQYILVVSDSTCIGVDTFNIAFTVCSLPPTAYDDCVEETTKNNELTIDVLANDTDPDQDQLIVAAIIVEPKFGTAYIDQVDQTIHYVPNRNFCGRDTLVYVMCDNRDGCDTATVCIKVNCVCEYPQVITPNGDGMNDNLFFPCISQVDGARLLVWHRWGLIVYEDNNYKNDWGGTLKGELLPAGTYWYSIEFDDKESNEHIKEVNYFMIIN